MHPKKILLIGIDGMDPHIAETMMGSRQLPNFLKLSEKGYYNHLATINPPQSPVGWASIATGCNPGEHGVYDFLGRNPHNYLPYLSFLKLDGSHYIPPLKAKTFWEKASEKGIKSTILRWPLTFPAQKINGFLLAGLGVPDIQGKLGTYTYYTTDTDSITNDKKGRIIKVNVLNNHIRTEIAGPFVSSFKGRKEVIIPLQIEILDGFIKCHVNNTDFVLSVGNWSDWIPLRFNLGFRRNIEGICKFYLKSTTPEFNLCVTPINITSGRDSFPISAPSKYLEELSKEIGLFATLGMPEDTNALNDELIDEDAFLKLCSSIMDEREGMFFYELERFQEGILACVFDTLDRIQHMFWRFTDNSHPRYDESLVQKYGDVISDHYKKMDEIIGRVLSKISSDTLLIICSDHGFSSFSKSVHLNTWLIQNGFMLLKNGASSSDGLFDKVDWNHTKAYSLGLNSIYLNIKNREGKGTVSNNEILMIKQDIISKLKTLSDSGRNVVKDIYNTINIFSGKDIDNAPDLLIGYEKGYRQSWQTAVGGAPAGDVVEDNLKKWSGDHCCDAEYVPGVVFTNQKVVSENPSVLDIAPAIMDHINFK